MTERRTLKSEEISDIVDSFEPIDVEEIEIIARLTPGQRIFRMLERAEAIRSDLRNKLIEDFPELSLPEINMKVLRSLTPVRIGKNYTEPAYHEYFG
ncbi:MAG TPA: hypothetical protein VJ821_04060 [Anaerolineales bacterium]|nr:hypothetical protein [Anaerolineales bacterium]